MNIVFPAAALHCGRHRIDMERLISSNMKARI